MAPDNVVRETDPMILYSSVNPDLTTALWFEYDRAQDILSARYNIRRGKRKESTGKVHFRLGAIRPFIASLMAGPLVGCSPPEIGFSFGSILSAAESVVRKVGASKIVDHVQTVMDSPVGDLAKTIYPPLGVSYEAAKKIGTLVQRVNEGDQVAKAGAARLAQAAAAGSAEAKRAVLAMSIFNRAIKAKEAQTGCKCPPSSEPDAIAGWLFNRPYRGTLARCFDKGDPGNIVRYLYNRGIED